MGIIINGQNDTIGPVDNSMSLLGTVSIGGTMTIEDFTNIDSVGLITARNGLHVTGGNVDIGGATHSRNLSVHDATNGVILVEGASNGTSNLMFADENDEDVGMLGYNHASNYLAVTVNAAERLRINSAGLVKVGGNETVPAATGIQIENAGAALLTLLRNDLTISDGNTLGGIDFYGNDGGSVQQVAKISAVADGTHGNNDKPTALVFQTTNDGAGSATEKLRITSGGDVVIGTTAAARGPLHIHKNSADCYLHVTNSTTGTGSGDGFTIHQSGVETLLNNRESGNMRLYTNGGEKVRIKSDGDVYIGNIAHSNDGGANSSYRTLTLTDTTNGAQLHLRGQSPKLFLDVTSGGNGEIYYDTGDLRILSGEPGGTSSERLRITSSGDVGINIAAPVAQLQVNTTKNAETDRHNATNYALALRNPNDNNGEAIGLSFGITSNTTKVGAAILHERDGGGSTGSLQFYTSPDGNGVTERLRILSDGKVAIGDVTANSLLDVHGGDGISITHSGDTFLQSRTTGTTGTNYLEFKDSDGGSGAISYHHNGDSLRFKVNGSERVRIASDGKFGIGTASPTAKLHVQSSSTTGEIRLGGGNGSGEHRLYFQAHPSTAYIDSYGNNTHNPLYINADPLILNTSGSGKVLINTTTNNDNKAKLRVVGTTDSGSIITGKIHDSTNSNNRTVLLHRMNTGQGFQFSGDIITNSWTGNAKVNCHITVHYTSQNVEVDVVNATHSSQISKTSLRVVTADYGSNRYLGIQKNGGGTGVFYINAFVGTNIDTSGNGGIREVSNSSLGSVTNQANLN